MSYLTLFIGDVFTQSRISAGEQLAVFRSQDGQAYVVDSYCPHLGANLAAGGRVVGNCIECPFHGWQFQGEDGKCARIPYAEKGEYPSNPQRVSAVVPCVSSLKATSLRKSGLCNNSPSIWLPYFMQHPNNPPRLYTLEHNVPVPFPILDDNWDFSLAK